MSRTKTKREANPSLAVIVDGEDEKWYLNKVKLYYQEQCPIIQRMRIKPDLPQKKKIDDLFNNAKNKFKEGYTDVILIIDFDDPMHKQDEMDRFIYWYNLYLSAKNNLLTNRQKGLYGWMSKLLVVINSPCLEYWYLLHRKKTKKFYNSYDELKKDLIKLDGFSDYEKNEDYYNKVPDIFTRLGGVEGLAVARTNSHPFDIGQCSSEGCSEMNQFFDMIDRFQLDNE